MVDVRLFNVGFVLCHAPDLTSCDCDVAAAVILNAIFVAGALCSGLGYAQAAKLLTFMGVGAVLHSSQFASIQKQLLPHFIAIAQASADRWFQEFMSLSLILYCAFDGGWLHRRHSGEHLGVITSENLFDHEGLQDSLSCFKVLAYKFIALDRSASHETGFLTLRAGNSISQTSQGMESEALLAVMLHLAPFLRAAKVKLCIALDGDLSNHDVLRGFSDVISNLVRDFGHLRKSAIKLLDDKKNVEYVHFKDVIIRWYTSCVYTGAQPRDDAVPASSSAHTHQQAGSSSDRIANYQWSQDEFRRYFLNLVEHLRGKHKACPPASPCVLSPEYELQEPHLQKCKDTRKIEGLKALLQAIIDLSGTDLAMTDVRTCRAESFHAFRTGFAPKDADFSVSAEARCCVAVSVLNDGFEVTFRSVLKAMSIQLGSEHSQLIQQLDAHRRSECLRAFEDEKQKRLARATAAQDRRDEKMPVDWMKGQSSVPLYGPQKRTAAKLPLGDGPSARPFFTPSGCETKVPLCERCKRYRCDDDFVLCPLAWCASSWKTRTLENSFSPLMPLAKPLKRCLE